MRKLRACLRLVRVGALPTAPADVWLGAAVVNAFATWETLWLTAVSLAIYAAGMILNDVADVERDRRDNPARPLPAGDLSLRAATIAGFALLVGAVVGAAFIGVNSLRVAAVLALLVLAYNFALKATAFGPLNMGLCRAANVALGLSAIPPYVAGGAIPQIMWAAPVFLYITSVTYLARGEDRALSRDNRRIACLGLAATGLLLIWLVFAGIAVRFHALAVDILQYGPYALMIAYFALVVSAAATAVWLVQRAKDVRRAVAAAILAVIPLEALAALGDAHLVEAACILLLIIPALVLRRLSRIS